MGKTVVTASLARAAALSGRSALIIEVEGKSGLPQMFGREALSYDEIVLSKGGGPEGAADIRARTITPDTALMEYLEHHGMSRLLKRLATSGALEVVATAVPGLRDILILGKVKALQRDKAADVLILDAPAAGHAINFLRSASAILDVIKVGPIHTQAADVAALLADHDRCEVVLVTLPEETPVNELIETAFSLEDDVGVGLGPVVVNGLYEDYPGLDVAPEAAAETEAVSLRPGESEALAGAADFRRHRIGLQSAQVARLADALPLPQIRLPFLFESELTTVEIDRLAGAVLDGLGVLAAEATR